MKEFVTPPVDERAGEEGRRRRDGLLPTIVALATLGALVALPYAVRSLARFRLLAPLPPGQGLAPAPAPAPSATFGETTIALETDTREEQPAAVEAPLPPGAADILPKSSESKPPRSIEDPSGHALDAFYAALLATESKKPHAVTRISYYGDSIVASDFVTATLRRKLQKRFGDAGHGFMLVANPWPGYAHDGVSRFAVPGWQVSRVVGPFAKDGLYGLGGVSFRSPGPGLFTRFATAKEGDIGRSVSRFVVDYLEQPNGGTIALKVDGADEERVATSADVVKSATKEIDVSDGPHELEVRALDANVRAFGVWMERDVPGVVVDALGIQGCRIRFLGKIDEQHWAEQLHLRDPNLVVFEYGMNESEDGELYPLDQYEATMKGVLEEVKRALPDRSCLLVGPMDRADKNGDGTFRSRPVVPKLAAIQRKVAGEVGCGYWDTLGAMGGFGSMGIWVQRGLGASDLTHPSSAGAEVIGKWISAALLEGYDAYRARAALIDAAHGGAP